MSTPRMRTGAFGAGLVAAALLGSSPAHAQAQAAAEALFNQGREAMQAGDYDKACGYFSESSKMERTVGTLYNLADCEEKRGHIATSWQLFAEVSARLGPDDARRQIAIQRREALATRLPKVVLKASGELPPSTTVRLGGAEFSQTAFGTPLPVDPGKGRLVVTADGYEANEVEIEIAEAQTLEVPISVGAAIVSTPADEESETQTTVNTDDKMSLRLDDEGGSSQRTWGFVALGVGGAALAAGGVFGYLTLQKKQENEDNCTSQTCNQTGLDAARTGKTYGVLTTIGLAAGAVGVGAGLYLIFTADSGSETVAVGGQPLMGGGALDVRARF